VASFIEEQRPHERDLPSFECLYEPPGTADTLSLWDAPIADNRACTCEMDNVCVERPIQVSTKLELDTTWRFPARIVPD